MESVKQYKDFYIQHLLGANSKSLGVNIFGLIYKIPPSPPPSSSTTISDKFGYRGDTIPPSPPPPLGEGGGRDPSNPI